MTSELLPAAPLIVASDDGLVLFASLEAARGYLEVPDVEAGVYGPAFDAEGRLIEISLPAELFEPEPAGRLARLFWRLGPNFNAVEVTVAEDQPNHREQLLALLQSVVKGRETDSLEELVSAASHLYGIIET